MEEFLKLPKELQTNENLSSILRLKTKELDNELKIEEGKRKTEEEKRKTEEENLKIEEGKRKTKELELKALQLQLGKQE